MSYSMSMDLKQKQAQSLKQLQRLIMSRQMQQAILLLQMPVLELSTVIDAEMEQNPVLEYSQDSDPDNFDIQNLENETHEDPQVTETKPERELTFDEKDFEILRQIDEEFRDHILENGNFISKTTEGDKLQTFLESSICAHTSLFNHLMNQAQETFSTPQEISMAESLIGNFDESGFLKVSLEEIGILNHFEVQKLEEILKVIQTFHPAGVGAANLQESLLLQLDSLGKKKTLAYEIIENHFDDLLHNRIPTIQKNLNCTTKEISHTIDKHISKLDLHPGAWFSSQIVHQITPDATIKLEDDQLIVEMSEDSLPALRLNSYYLKMLNDETLSIETKDFIRQKIMSAKWLLRNILQRNDTIERIAQSLALRQKEFFLNPKGKLVPLTMKAVADELHVHESTIARAVSNKYINTPKGLLALRFFFTSSLSTNEGEDISSNAVREFLTNIIENEDKEKPLSDEAISLLLKEKGIYCARRTVSKYRGILNIGNAQQRKKFNG